VSLTIATTLADALGALAAGARPIAGGTDLVVGARQGKVGFPDDLVSIDRIAELAQIDAAGDGLRVGAGVTHATLMTDAAIIGGYTAIADASALVGSPSTRNVGTIGGNVMNASPAMDTGAPLVVLGATAELASASGSRTVSLGDLWAGPGRTNAELNELCVAINLPAAPSGSAYVRLEYRRAMEIAVVGAAAAVIVNDDGTPASARVALTAVAPTIVEIEGLDVSGMSAADAADAAASAARTTATPISDLRASDEYRLHTIGVMASRAVDAAIRRANGEEISVPVNRAYGVGGAQ
jgi:CO/xanthine dehydrogenase FAD-binding subunit